MTNRERVLAFLQGVAPRDASNSEIVARTRITPHQQVFMITRDLMQSGQIKGVQAGHEWRFWYENAERGLNSAVSRPLPSHQTEMPNANKPFEWDDVVPLECRLGMTWTRLGRVTLEGERLRFPKAPLQPGLYRFRIRASSGDALYFGESENLARRFSLYASPGPSQQTNLRLNSQFRGALSHGSNIAVAVAAAGAWIEISGSREIADFASKAMRRLFEHAAIVASAGEPVESLNR